MYVKCVACLYDKAEKAYKIKKCDLQRDKVKSYKVIQSPSDHSAVLTAITVIASLRGPMPGASFFCSRISTRFVRFIREVNYRHTSFVEDGRSRSREQQKLKATKSPHKKACERKEAREAEKFTER